MNKHSISFISKLGIIALLLTVISGCSVESKQTAKALEDQLVSIADSNDPYVLSVKNGYPVDRPDQLYGDTFEQFFGSPTWTYFKAEDGEHVVEFTGNMMYMDSEVKARLQFIVNDDLETFEVGALSFNEVLQDQLITNAVLQTVFEDSSTSLTNSSNAAGTEESHETLENDQSKLVEETSLPNITSDSKNIFSSFSQDKQKAINIFFSNFSEAYLESFDNENYSKEDLIHFGVLHNYINNENRVELSDNYFTLKNTYVTDAIKKYFDLTIQDGETKQYEYEHDKYIWPAAAGDPYWNFTQVISFNENDEGTFSAELEIYSAGPDYEGNKKIYEPKSLAWSEQFSPELIGTATAEVKEATINNKQTYQLLKYNASMID